MQDRNTRETIDKELPYLFFDFVCDAMHAGNLDHETAFDTFRHLVGLAAVEAVVSVSESEDL